MPLKEKLFRKPAKQDPTLRLFSTLNALGFSPTHIVDIGGNRGDWTRRALQAFPSANVTVFEPQKSLRDYHTDLTQKDHVDLVYGGVGDTDGEAAFTFHDRDDSSSFLYSAEQASDKGFSQDTVQIHRLDTFVKSCRFGRPEMVKIDAEGFDLQVIEGAQDTLAAAEVVLVEAAVANPDYPNTVLTVLQSAERLGLKLFDITDLNRAPKHSVLWLVELVFVKRGGALDQAVGVYA